MNTAFEQKEGERREDNMYKAVRYNPAIHHRRSIRLKGYDYSRPGFYFITICVQGRDHLFGNINHAKMNLNDAGKMVEKWYYELENKFHDIKCHAMVVMPNHFHCIIENTGTVADIVPVAGIVPIENDVPIGIGIGADLCVCPYTGEHDDPVNWGEHKGSPLPRVVQWFKTMTTNEYIRGVKNLEWKRFDGKLWQRNYYERIIRDDRAFIAISKYIRNNPAKWKGN